MVKVPANSLISEMQESLKYCLKSTEMANGIYAKLCIVNKPVQKEKKKLT